MGNFTHCDIRKNIYGTQDSVTRASYIMQEFFVQPVCWHNLCKLADFKMVPIDPTQRFVCMWSQCVCRLDILLLPCYVAPAVRGVGGNERQAQPA